MSLPRVRRTLATLDAGWSAWRAGRGRDAAARARARAHLCERLGRLRGLPQKVGQMLSMSADGERAEALAPLQDSAEPLPLAEVLPLLAASWGRPPEQLLAWIEPRGLAASLGQVHRARLHDGREVAIKVRYPGIASAVESDLAGLGWVSRPLGGLGGGFDLEAWREVLRAGLEEELDYRREARNLLDLRAAARGLALVVPDLVADLSTDAVLVTTWEEGERLEQAARWPTGRREALAAELLRQFLTCALGRGVLHADPHPGNLRFRRLPEGVAVVLYDHGCVWRPRPEERAALATILGEVARDGVPRDPWPVFLALGFDAELLAPLRGRLAELATLLLAPFAADSFHAARSGSRQDLTDLLGEDRLNFRLAGPARLLFFLRAYQGLLHQLRVLDVALPARSIALEVLGGGGASGDLAPAAPVPGSSGDATPHGAAEGLEILVREAGRTKVRLTLPAGAVERLDQLLEGDLRARIEERGIDLEGIAREARGRGLAPAVLFELVEGERSVRVALVGRD